jgi:hypothetical protein
MSNVRINLLPHREQKRAAKKREFISSRPARSSLRSLPSSSCIRFSPG